MFAIGFMILYVVVLYHAAGQRIRHPWVRVLVEGAVIGALLACGFSIAIWLSRVLP